MSDVLGSTQSPQERLTRLVQLVDVNQSEVRCTDQFQDEADGLDATVHGGKEKDDDYLLERAFVSSPHVYFGVCERDARRRKGKPEKG